MLFRSYLKVSIYPVPASETIRLKADHSIHSLWILNTLGKPMPLDENDFLFQDGEVEVNIKSFPAGVYLLVCDDGKNFLRKTFVKK